ncbi:hypothetical protein LEP3755_43020 [Leptolyngbya sp. NIES-3755]|nr:hypothetical protein LEP3755_43020 [Leptolyngbya sp. NIES-3755]
MLNNHRSKICRSYYPLGSVRIGHNAKLLEKYDRISTQALLKLTAQTLTPKCVGGIKSVRTV